MADKEVLKDGGGEAEERSGEKRNEGKGGDEEEALVLHKKKTEIQETGLHRKLRLD